MTTIRETFTAIKEDKAEEPAHVRFNACVEAAKLEHPDMSDEDLGMLVAKAEPELHREYLDSNGTR